MASKLKIGIASDIPFGYKLDSFHRLEQNVNMGTVGPQGFNHEGPVRRQSRE